MNKSRKFAGVLSLGAASLSLASSMTSSAGLLDWFKPKKAQTRDQKKEKQGYEAAEKVATIFLEHFYKNEKDFKDSKKYKKYKNDVLYILEDLVLQKADDDTIINYYKDKINKLQEVCKLDADIIKNIQGEINKIEGVELKLKENTNKIEKKQKDSKNSTNFKISNTCTLNFTGGNNNGLEKINNVNDIDNKKDEVIQKIDDTNNTIDENKNTSHNNMEKNSNINANEKLNKGIDTTGEGKGNLDNSVGKSVNTNVIESNNSIIGQKNKNIASGSQNLVSIKKQKEKQSILKSFFISVGKSISNFFKSDKLKMNVNIKDKEESDVCTLSLSIERWRSSDCRSVFQKSVQGIEKVFLANSRETYAKKNYLEQKKKLLKDIISIAKENKISYGTIIDTLFKKLKTKKSAGIFGNNPLTNILWSKGNKSNGTGINSNKDSKKDENNIALDAKDKERLHELGYERNNSRFIRGVRFVGGIVLPAIVMAEIIATFPVMAGVFTAPIGCILSGIVSTVVDRVVFKTRFKENRKRSNWEPSNWEVKEFLRDTAKNTAISASLTACMAFNLKKAISLFF